MIVLGIEGTAHTAGVGIVENGRIIADVRKTYKPEGVKGIHPREAAQFLGQQLPSVYTEALEKAGLKAKEVECYAFSQGPGMGPCLRTVATAARTLALYHKKPLVGVNHCVAHIEIGKVLGKMEDPLALYVSGGNTQILKLEDKVYRIFGETLDIGIGNLLDKFGRAIGLTHPAGPKIEAMAKEGKKYIPLPYVVKGTDLSFSGILTHAIDKFKRGGVELSDLCFSLQETAFAMLCEVTERALAHLGVEEVLLVGGVGNNKRLQEMMSEMSSEHKANFFVPEGYCSDNGAMIALTGERMFRAGITTPIETSEVKPDWRTDQIEIKW